MGSKWGLAIRDAVRALAARRSREEGLEEAAGGEAGFTLIELMVVLLIMGILMAIAIPTFLGAANGAHDTASQSDLTNSLTSAKSIYATAGTYGTSTTAGKALKKAEPEMTYTNGTTGNKATYIDVSVGTTKNVLALASYTGTTKHCWIAVDNENASAVTVDGVSAPSGISYAMVTMGAATHPASCAASDTVTSWNRKYPS